MTSRWHVIQQSNIYAYESLGGAFGSLVRQGPSELLRGFLASSLRDAPYAGLFVVFYEGIKRETCQLSYLLTFSMHSTYHISLAYLIPPKSNGEATVIHGLSAASAGAIATLATHPFDVIKVVVFDYLSLLI